MTYGVRMVSGVDENRLKKVLENREMNGVEFNQERDPLKDRLYYWYSQRVSNSHVIPKFKIDTLIQSYLTGDSACNPRLSFIIFSKELEHVIERITFDYPTVLISQEVVSFHLDELASEAWKSEPTTSTVYSFFQVLNISRHSPGLRITITNWSDPRASRPIASDLKFPIKFVLLFADDFNGTDKIKKMLSTNFKPTFSGGKIEKGWRKKDSTIIFNDLKNHQLKASQRITIAFAGREVYSAILYVHTYLGPEFREDLEEFKRNLKFSIDEGRVVGFIFEMDELPYNNIFPTVSKFFPGIPLIRLVMQEIFNYPGKYRPISVLHLIRY
ncbi:uncharacterized protein LOC141849825 isoform X2 [Brevipalpus obovatus]|uniref:uncharacterized protein LOC141849825 isoform X2 n=1 Tax=Brevipalpus obovatus TaxID=246614 RepID=UPI003D9F0538